MINKLRFYKKIIIFVVAVILLLVANRWMALREFGELIENNYQNVINALLGSVLFLDLIFVVYDLLRYVTYISSKRIWDTTVKDLEIGIKRNVDVDINNNMDEDKQIINECLFYLMSYKKGTVDATLLDWLKKCYQESNDTSKQERIAYLFLANKSNPSVAEFCSTIDGREFLKKCEDNSKNIVSRTTFNCERLDFESKEFEMITNEFLHFGLPNGVINTVERIDYIRKVLSWVKKELKSGNAYRNTNFQLFMIVLAKVEKNLFYHGITDEIIRTYIRQIKSSWRFFRMYWNANINLWKQKTSASFNSIAGDVGLIIAHNNRFGILYRVFLQHKVKKSIKEYKKIYHEMYKEAIYILVLAMPLGSLKNPDIDFADKVLTVIDVVGGSK